MNDPMLVYAAKHYQLSGTTTDEFMGDLNKVNLVARNISRYHQGNNVTLRLLLNQIVTLGNVFGVAATSIMLFQKVPEDQHGLLFPLLVYLGYMDEDLLTEHSVQFNQDLVNQLREVC